MERLTWPLEQVHGLRDDRLRELLVHARDRSPWHRARLTGRGHRRASPATTCPALPTMTKADLMANWDAISCDPSLTLAAAQACLDHVVAAARSSSWPET